MSKPTRPNISVPAEFAVQGQKADFNEDKILNGFKSNEPDVLSGENFNKFIDDTYKGLNYALDLGDYVNNKLLNKTQISNCILEAPNGVITYSGNTVTLKAGLKVLIPQGRNADGTLRNVEYTLENDITTTVESNRNENACVVLSTTGGVWLWTTAGVGSYEIAPATNLYYRYFDEDLNYFRETTNGGAYHNSNVAVVAIINVTNGNVNSILTAFQPIRLFTSADKSYIASMGMPSNKYINLTIGASGTKYTAPANGYYNICRFTNGQNDQYVDLVNKTTGFFVSLQKDTVGVIRLYAPVRKRDVLQVNYTATGSGEFDFFRFYYAQGSESEAN